MIGQLGMHKSCCNRCRSANTDNFISKEKSYGKCRYAMITVDESQLRLSRFTDMSEQGCNKSSLKVRDRYHYVCIANRTSARGLQKIRRNWTDAKINVQQLNNKTPSHIQVETSYIIAFQLRSDKRPSYRSIIFNYFNFNRYVHTKFLIYDFATFE